MQTGVFEGRLADAVKVNGEGEKAVSIFTLISNEYAGKDEQSGEAQERKVAVQFAASGSKGKVIAEHVKKGDQLVIQYRIENNVYEKEGEKVYSYNFKVRDFSFGAKKQES